MHPSKILSTVSSHFTGRLLTLVLAADIATAHVILWYTATTVVRPLQIVFGLLLVLVLPGYVLIEAVLPTRAFDLIERSALSAGLSIAITALSSIFLNLTPWGLQRGSWTVLLDGIVILLSIVALVRQGEATAPVDVSARTWPFSVAGGAAVGVGVLMAAGALGGAARGAERISSPKPLEMWVVSSGHNRPVLDIGVRTFQSSAQTFGIVGWRGCSLMRRWGPFTVRSARTWHGTLNVRISRPFAQPVQLFLYRPTSPWAPVRRITWWPSTGQLAAGCTVVTSSPPALPVPLVTSTVTR